MTLHNENFEFTSRHTHELIDQIFSRIAIALARMLAMTFSDLAKIITYSYEPNHKVMKAFENMKLRSADFMNIAYSTPVGRKNKLESRSFHLRILWEIKRKVDLKAFILYQLFSLSLQNVRKRNLQNVQFRWKLHTLCSIWFFFKIFSLKEIKYNTAGYIYVWKSFHLIKQN